MIRNLLLFFLTVVTAQSALSQNLTAKIIDAESRESIPYATITINQSTNLISNAEGYFTIADSAIGDDTILTVSYLGYSPVQLNISTLKKQNLTITMVPGVFELDNVNVPNEKPDPDKIMAEVKKNISTHYKPTNKPSKNMIFFREANTFKPKKLDLEITKSTGFTKKALATANSQLAAFTKNIITSPPQHFTDMLCNYYSSSEQKDGKTVAARKLEVVKATRLKDENKSASLEDMEKVATNILLQHVDSTKYYRIKSGWFGSRDTISLRKDYQKKKKKKAKRTEHSAAKSGLMTFMTDVNPALSRDLDFMKNPEIYKYTYEGAVYSDQSEFVYVLSFKPKKNKAKYTGKLYISENDYAVVRADYDLAEGKKLESLNLRLLLGVKYAENVSRGTLIYSKNTDVPGYYLQYASVESGQYMYINRPLKFIELTKEEKDVVALDLKMEANSIEKQEYLSMSRSEISESAFKNIDETDFSYIRIKKYDPSIWKNYSAIEPLEEMKQYKVAE